MPATPSLDQPLGLLREHGDLSCPSEVWSCSQPWVAWGGRGLDQSFVSAAPWSRAWLRGARLGFVEYGRCGSVSWKTKLRQITGQFCFSVNESPSVGKLFCFSNQPIALGNKPVTVCYLGISKPTWLQVTKYTSSKYHRVTSVKCNLLNRWLCENLCAWIRTLGHQRVLWRRQILRWDQPSSNPSSVPTC